MGRFVLKNGVFHAFCKEAARDPSNSYVFIIDEINRGNLSKIFGELMVLMEAEHRGPEFAIPLTYSTTKADRFYIPSNVHILGLMNTADRSLAMVDYALRRRFSFVDLMPAFDSPVFREYLANAGVPELLVNRIVTKMSALNDTIEADKDLGRSFRVGHSFFCPSEQVTDHSHWFTAVVRDEVAPLLREYWFDEPERASELVNQLLAP